MFKVLNKKGGTEGAKVGMLATLLTAFNSACEGKNSLFSGAGSMGPKINSMLVGKNLLSWLLFWSFLEQTQRAFYHLVGVGHCC